MRVLIASTYVPFIKGGATKIVDDLHQELTARGFESDRVFIPFSSLWTEVSRQTVAMRLLDLTESCGNRIDRLITIRYPSYALRHPNKVAWFIHHHREAFDLWDTPYSSIPKTDVGRHYRDLMHQSDNLHLGECRKVFTNSRIVADRLETYNDLSADGILYPPLPQSHRMRPGPFGDYIFYASRLTGIKRQDLAIRALACTRQRVKLVIAGTGDAPEDIDMLRETAERHGVTDRVQFTGWISEEQKAEWMAGCCGSLYLAFDEDSYGYATLEAFHAHKPVITLRDSGGSLEVIRDGHNGYIRQPEPEDLADAMDRLWSDRAAARRLGENAFATIEELQINWDHVINHLTA